MLRELASEIYFYRRYRYRLLIWSYLFNLLGSLGIADGDDVELGNLHRQVTGTVWDAVGVGILYVTATYRYISAYIPRLD